MCTPAKLFSYLFSTILCTSSVNVWEYCMFSTSTIIIENNVQVSTFSSIVNVYRTSTSTASTWLYKSVHSVYEYCQRVQKEYCTSTSTVLYSVHS